MSHWMEGDWPDGPYPVRCCERCRKPMPPDHDYAWCEDCWGEPCKHGNDVSECNECMVESDQAYDAMRER